MTKSSVFPSHVLVFDTPDQVALAAADRFAAQAAESISDHGIFTAVLSGGSTPKRLYQVLAQEPLSSRIEWSNVHLFFGDERNVTHDHPDSNYRMALEALISHVPIPAENVHPIQGAGETDENAAAYERELKRFFSGREWPRFDLVLLGLGPDGHTASLFPRTDALYEDRKWVTANVIKSMGTSRITLTIPAINSAANVDFVVTGIEKAAMLATVMEGPTDGENRPAQLIQPETGTLTWLLDAAAASQLKSDKL